MTLAHVTSAGGIAIDEVAILKSLKLDPRDPKAQALVLSCERYGLDPILRHAVLIDGNLNITRDGLLHVAHSSGQFDGMEVLEETEDETHYIARVAVYRKDMSRPFTFRGRFPKAGRKGTGHAYAVEMAVKCAEAAALRRAFDVALPTEDERLAGDDISGPPAGTLAGVPPELTPATLNLERFLQACADEEVDPGDVVERATGGRTRNPGEVLETEVQKLRDALRDLAAESGEEATGDPPPEASSPNTEADDTPVATGASASVPSREVPPDGLSDDGTLSPSDRDIATLTARVFAAPYAEAPHGQKNRILTRLRHALTFAVTNGAVSLKDLTPEQRGRLKAQLVALDSGRVVFDVDETGVTFRQADAKPSAGIRVDWTQFETTTTEEEPADG